MSGTSIIAQIFVSLRAISYKLEKTDRQQSQLVCIKAYAKFRQVLCMYSVNIEQKRNKDFN